MQRRLISGNQAIQNYEHIEKEVRRGRVKDLKIVKKRKSTNPLISLADRNPEPHVLPH
jgi:hypothetical protein